MQYMNMASGNLELIIGDGIEYVKKIHYVV